MARYSRNDQAGVELPKARLDRETLRQALELLSYLKPYRVRFSIALAALFSSSLMSLAFPYFAGSIVDSALVHTRGGEAVHGVNRTALLLLLILAVQAGFSFFHALSFASVGQRSLVDLRRDVYARLITLPMTFFSQRRVGELASRLSADLVQIEDTLTAILPQLLRQSTMLLLYTTFVAGAMGQFAELYSQIQKTVGATQRVRELLRESGELVATAEAPVVTMPRLRGEIVFEDVSFSYPSRAALEVLHGIDLTAAPGERIALVGPSGAGKSTIISLLLRLYDPGSGRILIDGTDARDYPLAGLRSQMSMVPQEVLLFGGSIGENIAYGKPGASQKEIEKAARQANAHEFVESFPEGYGALVGERGIKLSGGQRQRVAIARAILKDPAVLILDEATSSLDSESERLIQEALETLMRNRTSFIIAHRLATIRHVDKILVISGGRVVESGTHQTLQAIDNGVYRRLASLQFRETGVLASAGD